MCKTMKYLVIVCLVVALFFEGASALQCLVGTGNATEIPASSEDIKAGKYPPQNAAFKRFTCGERGSQLAIIDNLVKNVTDKIEAGLGGLKNALGSLTGNSRKKREADANNYACVKVVLGSTAYRSCVPKYGNIRLNCTSIIGQNVLCYCHVDDCNSAPSRALVASFAIFASLMISNLL